MRMETSNPIAGALRQIELQIEKLVYEGAGLARCDGKVFFVDEVLPGERILAEIIEEKRDFGRGRVVKILEASPDRITAPCPYFGQCGGCQWQHIPKARQNQSRVDILAELLARQKIEHVPSIRFREGPPFGYRNRQRFHRLADGSLGMFRLHSQDGIRIDACPLMNEPMNEALARLQTELPGESYDAVTLFSDAQRVLAAFEFEGEPGKIVQLLPPDGAGQVEATLQFALASYRFKAAVTGFFQVNSIVAEAMLQQMEAWISGMSQRSVALDLYAGAGFFTLPLARHFALVVAVEENADAVAAGRLNISANDASHAQYFCASVEAWLRQEGGRYRHPDLLCVDPPRDGLGRFVVERIVQLAPRYLVYVSCNPSTLARDLRSLAAHYQLEDVVIADLFPQTYHIETMVLLRNVAMP